MLADDMALKEEIKIRSKRSKGHFTTLAETQFKISSIRNLKRKKDIMELNSCADEEKLQLLWYYLKNSNTKSGKINVI